MKNFNNKTALLLLAFALLFLNSCNTNDDGIFFDDSDGVAIIDDNNTGDDNSGGGSTDDNQQTGNDGEITLYSVSKGDISKIKDYKVSGVDLEFQKDINKHKQIWTLVKKIVPLNQMEKMSEFMIYNGDVSGSAGYVIETNSDLSKWQMGIAIDYAFEGSFNADGELAYTIIHEFGHILTLNDTQLNATISKQNCANYFPGEGCSNATSYINEMYQKYWKDIENDFSEAQDDQSKQEAFYNKYSDRFVTNYASTNPGEDIAEVFTTFVTKKEKPSGSTIAERKILLMYDRAELINFRTHIRKNLNLRGKGANNTFILPEPGTWKQANTFGNSKKTKCRHKH